jgi:thiosulfate/3-mercaptopyruvate sulfurtransferase
MGSTSRMAGSLFAALLLALVTASAALADHKHASTIPAAALIEPADFAAALKSGTTPRPLILQVGFRKAYAQAHIPGSEYVGAGSEDEGLAALRQRVAKIPKDQAIVIYCGCCPWRKCPNIAAAFDVLHDLGYTHVQVIHIDEDFETNWVDPGYPTEKGA